MPELPSADAHDDTPQNRGWGALKTGAIIAGSAFLGGLAVVFWNRKSLARLRQSTDDSSQTSVHEDADTE